MRNKEEILSEYNRWLAGATADADLRTELERMDAAAIEDAFYRDLEFGTGGLRGTIGAGTNRMNVYTVAKASLGLGRWLGAGSSVVIGYDTRLKSDLFARVAAGVFAAGGIRVFLWPEPLPVPTVSFAVRRFKASAGVMITASHNPGVYNGYKVYGADGCQITTGAAAAILAEIERCDCFAPPINPDPPVEFIGADVLAAYTERVKQESVLFGDGIDRNLAIVYTPLNGTGLKPVTGVLRDCGFTNITVVEEQRLPDGRFPTCHYPNPEMREALELGLRDCRKTGADLLLATDPDCDRCGIAVRDGEDYRTLTGNEVGLLLLDYVCSQRIKHNRMPADPVFIKTIVTMDLAERIAARYGVRTVNVLTGFKFIGEQIGLLERSGKENSFICGFEESYGYLTGPYVRDKDAVNAALLICEMFAFYKTRGVSLPEKLQELWDTYGYCLNTLHNYAFPGSAGMARMQEIMASFRRGVAELGGMKVLETLDYSRGLDGLPKSDVLKFVLQDGGSLVIRPSGTEPKLKVYVSVSAADEAAARAIEDRLAAALNERIGS